ncbi:MAG: flagellar biosynthesis protein FlhB [Candidatus Gastranaerophilales bacterium]|nr:flagellar biosynthesis protein FlhB [Candidatus Gastranaerophilales bacterium]
MANDQNEKTEEATPKRKQKERDKGHIAKSQDFTSSLMLTFGLGLIMVMGSKMQDKLSAMLITTFSQLSPKNISNNDAIGILAPFVGYYADIVLLFFALLAIGAIIIMRFQTGALFAKEALKPNFKKLSPASVFKNLIDKINIFKPKQMVELVKSLLKTIIVAVVGFNIIMKRRDDLFGLIGADPSTGFVVIGSVILELLTSLCILLIIIGILDRYYQTWEYNKSIKMTKQEVKDEWKNIEGDPKIKGKIRSFQMKIMQQKMMANVKEADVVVVNPTHFAVALMYNPEKVPAPVVVAKGVDFIAFKIREIAKNNNIPIVENKPLARSLYKLVEVNQIIPQELYTAVAEILHYVYSQKGK